MAKIDMETEAFPGDGGMTLRDFFAASALVGILSRESIFVSETANTKSMVARFVFGVADAMMEARGVETYETLADVLAASREK